MRANAEEIRDILLAPDTDPGHGSREERLDSIRCTMYRGFVLKEAYAITPEGWETMYAWCDEPYRVIWRSREQRAILTYCEGDLTLELFDDDVALAYGTASAARFYRADQRGDNDGPSYHPSDRS